MPTLLERIHVKNYRSLQDVSLPLQPINLLFGPNGAGKSTLLDTIWFVRDCFIRSVEQASAARSHGIGMLYDGAAEGEGISIKLSSAAVSYELFLNLSAGRIEPFPGERLLGLPDEQVLLQRVTGSTQAIMYPRARSTPETPYAKPAGPRKRKPAYKSALPNGPDQINLREPEKPSLGRYLDDYPDGDVSLLDRLLHQTHLYHSRSFLLRDLRKRGSERGTETWLWDQGENLWSVLANLQSRRRLDDRYETIIRYMRRCFPSFDDVVVEPTAPTIIYAQFLEKGRRKPIRASGVADGHLQMLILLTALFGELPDRPYLLLFDEPDTSLHPWALAVLAEAIKDAADSWNRQVVIATHSPVLMSQFAEKDVLVAQPGDGSTRIVPIEELAKDENLRDLLERFSVGSLYMADAIAPQGPPAPAGPTK